MTMRSATLVFFISAAMCYGAEPTGRWEGAAQLPGMDLRLVVDLAPAADGTWNGSLIVPGLGIKGERLAGVNISETSINFSVKGALSDPKFVCRWNPDGTLTGEVTLAGNTAPLALHKIGPPQVEKARVAFPVQKEVEGDWRGEMNIAGYKFIAHMSVKNQPAGSTAEFAVGLGKEDNLPVTLVTQEGDWVTVQAHDLNIAFEGRYIREKDQLDGAFVQGGVEFPLVFSRVSTK